MSEELTQSDREELEKYREERTEQRKKHGIYLKVSQKGGVSLYGLQKWPITFYRKQWLKIFEIQDSIKKFIVINDAVLNKQKEKETK